MTHIFMFQHIINANRDYLFCNNMYYTRRNIIDCLTNSRNNYTWCHTPFRGMRWTTKLITPVVMHNSRKWAEQYFLANYLFASIVCVDTELRKFGQYGNHLQYHVSSLKQITRSKSYAKWQTNHSSNFPFQDNWSNVLMVLGHHHTR